MEDLAMHMLEIIMNSVGAESKNIHTEIMDSEKENLFSMSIEDDGRGMHKALLSRVADPFTTTRDTRRIGMGVPFMKGLTEQCGGTFDIKSTPGVGTKLSATVMRNHIDRPPLGDLGEMMMHAIQGNERIDHLLTYKTDDGEFIFDTREIRRELEGVSLTEPEILIWMRDYINENLHALSGRS